MEHEYPWPHYFHENLVVGNINATVGVVTLWTPKEHFAKHLDPQLFSVVGQLYSNDGVNSILRNVLSHPYIRTIILCGMDRIGSADALTLLLENGVNDNHQVIGKEEVYVEKEITREAIERFREHVTCIDMRGVLKPQEIVPVLEKHSEEGEAWAQPEFFPEPEFSAEWYPSEESVYVYRGNTVADVWPKMLHATLRFGEKKRTNHSEGMQYELLNLTAVIEEEDPAEPSFPDYFPFTKEHFEGYKPQVMTAEPMESLSYTYGMRLRDADGVNQVEEMIQKLKEHPWDRQAVGALWDVQKDHASSHPPCLNIVHALIKYDKLFLTCYLRSNDIFRAWPENALAFRCMQKEIADGIGLPMGSLTTIASSAHIYEESVLQAQEIVDAVYPDLPCQQDPRGNYAIQVVENTHIQVIHMTPTGKKVRKYEGKTAMDLFNQIARDQGVSVLIHAFDLGAELQKAEIALRSGMEYTQDRPLPLNQLTKR